jgi:AraC-like DNA-binding protein
MRRLRHATTLAAAVSAVIVIIRHMTSPSGPQRVDPIDRAHLTGVSRPSPPIHRYAPSPHLVDLVERHWIPVWSLAEPSTQSTLQHPVCLVVISNTYARFYGVSRGRSSVTLEGDGWAVGTMLSPAAGRLVLGRSVATVTDTWIELSDVVDDPTLVAGTRAAMAADPHDPASHLTAIGHVERWLATHLPVDEAGVLVNRLVKWLAAHPEVSRVDEVARAMGLSERSLQRLVEQRVGLSPKWLLQRRRLHDAVEALKGGPGTLAEVAAALGYADQAHFTHDFRTVTGMTPGEYLRDQPVRSPRG